MVSNSDFWVTVATVGAALAIAHAVTTERLVSAAVAAAAEQRMLKRRPMPGLASRLARIRGWFAVGQFGVSIAAFSLSIIPILFALSSLDDPQRTQSMVCAEWLLSVGFVLIPGQMLITLIRSAVVGALESLEVSQEPK